MKIINHAVFIFASFLAISGCQSNSAVPDSGSHDGESRYAEEQDREAYLNSPGFINVQLGVAYMQKGDLNVALSKLRKALRQSPQLAIAHNSIAILYARLGEIGLAESHFERSISLDRTDSRLRNNYGRFLCQHRTLDAAIVQFDLAANNPLYQTPYRPLVNAGICSLNGNKLEQADQYLRKALRQKPKLGLALVGMIRLSVLQNQYAQGKAYLDRYLVIAKHNADSLWYGYQIEKKLGNTSTANNYAVRLKTRYPDSEQTRLLLSQLNVK